MIYRKQDVNTHGSDLNNIYFAYYSSVPERAFGDSMLGFLLSTTD